MDNQGIDLKGNISRDIFLEKHKQVENSNG